jgi:acetyltransferase-like isoleucine patch superfamily enzyme
VIKPNCFIGLNSTIGNGVTIAKENLIGAGSVVIKNTLDEAVIVPARSTLLNKKSSEIKL